MVYIDINEDELFDVLHTSCDDIAEFDVTSFEVIEPSFFCIEYDEEMGQHTKRSFKCRYTLENFITITKDYYIDNFVIYDQKTNKRIVDCPVTKDDADDYVLYHQEPDFDHYEDR